MSQWIDKIGSAIKIASGQQPTFSNQPSLTEALISAGAGLTLAGIGTLFSKGALAGFATTLRNPVASENVIYGRARVGGTLVYCSEWGDKNKFLDIVIVLAAHPCHSVDALLFDNQRVQIGANNTSFSPPTPPVAINRIVRVGNVVTVYLNANIPLAVNGDHLIIEGVHPVSAGLNGRFPITIIDQVFGAPGSLTFTYLSGGTAIDIPSFGGSESGRCRPAWPDYGSNVYMDVMLGDQNLGFTFPGMVVGTPLRGDVFQPQIRDPNPWTNYCSLVGKTAVFLRLHYDSKAFAGGIPQISFLVHGKNNIMDPRSSPPTYGYTENPALIIAEYLSDELLWGEMPGSDTQPA